MPKILVVEDEILTLNTIREILEAEDFQVIGAANGEQGLNVAQQELPDLVLCDVMLPTVDGYQLLSSLRKNSKTAKIPFIFLTAKITKEDICKGMNLGADDYIGKPFFHERLLKSIATQISKRAGCKPKNQSKPQVEKAREKTQESEGIILDHFIYFDVSTRLPKRMYLRDRFNYMLESDAKNSLCFDLDKSIDRAVFYIHLDNLDKIDHSTRQNSNRKLISTAVLNCLTNCFGQTAAIVPCNNDDFAVILPYIGNKNVAVKMAQFATSKLLQSFWIKKQKFFLSPYIGITFYPDDGSDIAILLQRAQQASNQAKQKREERCQVYQVDTNNNTNTSTFSLLGNDLHHAFQREKLQIHYQPQINLQNGEIVACEALLRWQHSEHGNIMPSIFIPIAEKIGLIHSIDTWLLTKACQQLKVWHQGGLNKLKLSVNLSTYQFERQDLDRVIIQALEQADIAPKYLAIELTEDSLVNDPQSAIDKINCLKSLGLELIIDDFGTGYSSLRYLKQFAVDVLKIDRSLINNLFIDEQYQAIALEIIQMAHSFGFQVIAEGVETQRQLNFLHQHQCDAVAGYLMSHPLPPAEFSELFRENHPDL